MYKDVIERLKNLNPKFESKWSSLLEDLKNSRNEHVHAFVEKYDMALYQELVIKGLSLYLEVLQEIKKCCPPKTKLLSKNEVLPPEMWKSVRTLSKQINFQRSFQDNCTMVLDLFAKFKKGPIVFEKLLGIQFTEDENYVVVKCPICNNGKSCKIYTFISRISDPRVLSSGVVIEDEYLHGKIRAIICQNCGAYFKNNLALSLKGLNLRNIAPNAVYVKDNKNGRFDAVYTRDQFPGDIPETVTGNNIVWSIINN